MTTVLLVIHLLVAVVLIGVVLVQRSEGGALGIGGSGGGGGGFMSGRGTANLLTRATAILAAVFMVTSLGLALLHTRERAPTSILDDRGVTDQPAADTAAPAAPAVPLAK
ncbi:MAG: preprotein translocase subunit SecG [Alphaproteobacteria bacterium]|nr:preprotein translocase subunit SecG [Alphaproteobacteria bacterium]